MRDVCTVRYVHTILKFASEINASNLVCDSKMNPVAQEAHSQAIAATSSLAPPLLASSLDRPTLQGALAEPITARGFRYRRHALGAACGPAC